MKYLGIDLGEKRIGLAVSDERGIIAAPYATIQRESDKQAIHEIKEACTKEKIEALVLGVPFSANPTVKNRFLSFAKKLEEKIKLPLKTWDETFSTKQAQNMVAFSDRDPNRKPTKDHRDHVAAAIILQEFLDNETRS